MDVTHESARGEEPAVDIEDAGYLDAEGVKPPLGEVSSPSPLDEFDSAALLEALDESSEARDQRQEGDADDELSEAEADFADDAEAEADTASRKPPQRLSVRGLPPEQQFQLAEALDLVRRGEAQDLRAALGLVDRQEAGDQRQDGGEPEAFAEYDLPQDTGEGGEPEGIQQRIRALRAQRRQAIDDFDRPAEARLTEEIEDLQLDLLRAEQAGQAREAEGRHYQESYLSAVDAMEARYPEALDEQSAFHRILDNKIAAAQARQDPALADPEFILQFADEVASMLGGHGAGSRPPAQKSRPVGSVLAPGHQTAARPSREQMSRMIHEIPLEELERLVCTE